MKNKIIKRTKKLISLAVAPPTRPPTPLALAKLPQNSFLAFRYTFGIAILLILVVNFGFILAEEIEISEEIVSFDSEKVDYKVESEYGQEVTTLSFINEGGFVEIKGNRFENILPESESVGQSYIKIDNKGNILEADLTANEKGSTFFINGLTFKAPPNSRVHYDKAGFFLENIEVSGASPSWVAHGEKDTFVEQTIQGDNINFFNELFLDSGTVYLQKEGYLIQSGGNFNYGGMQIRPQGINKILIEKNPLKDLSKYEENFIQHTDNGLKIQSQEDALGFNLRFLEGNEIFEINNKELPQNTEHFLSMDISGGDGVEVTKKDYIIKGMPPLIKHSSSEQGETIIKDGRHIFKFKDGKYISELGNLNTKNKLSVEFNLDSDVLGAKTINVDDDNGYSIFELGKGNIFTFNKASLDEPNYNFESEIAKEINSFAENQAGDSVFFEEGRGQCYGEEELKIKGFDCIGLAIAALKKAYPGSSLKDFPPNLKLVEVLEKKGWESYIVEPAGVVGEETAKNSVKNIPPGSIVFLMHDYGSEDSEILEGIAQQKYLNSKDEEIILTLGHTLIRGTGEKNFINAKPGVLDEELPLRARKINENLIKQGKSPIFYGAVREGEFIPQDDYLIVISPPKD